MSLNERITEDAWDGLVGGPHRNRCPLAWLFLLIPIAGLAFFVWVLDAPKKI